MHGRPSISYFWIHLASHSRIIFMSLLGLGFVCVHVFFFFFITLCAHWSDSVMTRNLDKFMYLSNLDTEYLFFNTSEFQSRPVIRLQSTQKLHGVPSMTLVQYTPPPATGSSRQPVAGYCSSSRISLMS